MPPNIQVQIGVFSIDHFQSTYWLSVLTWQTYTHSTSGLNMVFWCIHNSSDDHEGLEAITGLCVRHQGVSMAVMSAVRHTMRPCPPVRRNAAAMLPDPWPGTVSAYSTPS